MAQNTNHLTVPSAYIYLLINIVSRWNISAEQLLLGSSLISNDFNKDTINLHWQIDYQTFAMILRRAIQLTQESGLGFYIAKEINYSTHGLLGFAASLAKNLKESIDILVNYLELQTNAVVLKLEVIGNAAYLYMIEDFLDLNDELDRLVYDVSSIFFVVGCANAISKICGFSIKPAVDFKCEKHSYLDNYKEITEELLGSMQFNQPHSRIIFPASCLEAPLITSDRIFAQYMENQCRRELDSIYLKRNIIFKISDLIFDEKKGVRSFEEIAHVLNMSQRTLQRVIQNHHQSFKSMREAVLQKKAKSLLLDNNSIQEISDLLGYSNMSSFNRAFKAWFGTTPKKYLMDSKSKSS